MKLNKTSIIIAIILLTVIITVGWFILRPHGKITFTLAPEEMTLSINNKERKIINGQSISLNPGTYGFKFSRDEFSSVTKTIVVNNKDVIDFAMALNPKTDAAKKLITDNPQSAKIIERYQLQQESQLASLMPVNGTGYVINSCRSVLYPQSERKAFCVTTKDDTGLRFANVQIKQLGFDPEKLEIMSGQKNLMTILKTNTYKVEAYTTDSNKKPDLYITPLNVPYVPVSTPRNEQLESIRTDSLADLKTKGYKLDNYEIIFSNVYLSRYNADHVHSSEGDHSLE
jgi:hypothetical protein